MSSRYWTVRFARWRPERRRRPGFTVVVPVPGDLPVFTELALSVVRLQRSPNRVATMVVPDRPSAAVAAVVQRHRRDWADGELVLRRMVRPERWLLPRLGNPGRNHAVQIITAARASRTRHLLLHDSDLFALSRTLHEDSYRTAVQSDADVVGVSAAWDRWFSDRDLRLAATWEMVCRARWLRSHPPHRVMAHDAAMFGETHTFDTTFWGQAHTEPSRLLVRSVDDELVHFNYVISTYRNFRRTTGPFTDKRFRLLLIRLFIDMFDPHAGPRYELPSGDELVTGLTDPSARVTYTATTRANYVSFRRQLDQILDGPWAQPGARIGARTTVAAFDAHFGALAGSPEHR